MVRALFLKGHDIEEQKQIVLFEIDTYKMINENDTNLYNTLLSH